MREFIFSDSRLIELCRAIENDRPEVIDTLVADGADLNGTGKFGFTPLHWAYHANCSDVVFAALLRHGADPNRMLERESNAVVKELASLTDRPVGPYGLVLTDGFIAVERERSSALIHLVSMRSFTDKSAPLLDTVIRCGGDINLVTRSQDRETPLHYAVRGATFHPYAGRVRVEALLKAGADPNARNSDGDTPLDIAHEGGVATARLLLEHQAEYIVPATGKYSRFIRSILKHHDRFRQERRLDPDSRYVREQYWKVVQRLRREGVDIDAMMSEYRRYQGEGHESAQRGEYGYLDLLEMEQGSFNSDAVIPTPWQFEDWESETPQLPTPLLVPGHSGRSHPTLPAYNFPAASSSPQQRAPIKEPDSTPDK